MRNEKHQKMCGIRRMYTSTNFECLSCACNRYEPNIVHEMQKRRREDRYAEPMRMRLRITNPYFTYYDCKLSVLQRVITTQTTDNNQLPPPPFHLSHPVIYSIVCYTVTKTDKNGRNKIRPMILGKIYY